MAWQDTFVRADQSGWGTASDGETWSHPIGTATLSIASNEGVVTGQSARQILLLGSQSIGNCQGIMRMAIDGSTDAGSGILLRANSAGTNAYQGIIFAGGGTIAIGKIAGGSSSLLATSPFTPVLNTFYWIVFQANGSNLYLKVWQDGTAQPNSWSLTTTDTTYTSGQFGFRAFPQSATNKERFDNFQIYPTGQSLIGNHKAIGRFAFLSKDIMASRTNPIGISSHLEQLSFSDVDRQLDLMQAAGVHWVRQEFPWIEVEPTQGNWTFAKYDYIVSGILQRGMQVIGLLSQYNTPTWYRGSAPWNQPPAPQDYAHFAQGVVSHYQGQISLYEAGNEPNEPIFWYPNPDPVAYSALLKAAYSAIKAADSSAKVISAGLSPTSPENFLTAMYANGAQGYMDYVGYHPYSHPNSPDYTQGTPSFSELASIYSIMINNGDGNKQIMATEVGWPTFSGGNTEANQATYIGRIYQKIMHESFQYVAIACIYDFVDDGTDPNNPEHHFGVLHTDYTQKPAYSTMQTERADYNANFTPINP